VKISAGRVRTAIDVLYPAVLLLLSCASLTYAFRPAPHARILAPTFAGAAQSPPATNPAASFTEVKPPSNHPPMHITIDVQPWTIHFGSYLSMSRAGLLGETDTDRHEIWVRGGDADVRQVMMHELLHATKFVGDRELIDGFSSENWMQEVPVNAGTNIDHAYIEVISPVLLRTLRDNPKLTKWLTQPVPVDGF
jgi:hypothetical protein